MSTAAQFTCIALALICVGHAVGFCPSDKTFPCEDFVDNLKNEIYDLESMSSEDVCTTIEIRYEDIVAYMVKNEMIPRYAADYKCKKLREDIVFPHMATLPDRFVYTGLDTAAQVCDYLVVYPEVVELVIDILVANDIISWSDVCV